MKRILMLICVAVALADELPLAEVCDPEACQLPDCRCSSTGIPGNLSPRDTPQFVLVTFDDAVNIINMETYRTVLNGRFNSNQCPASATFYVSHEYTSYVGVNELYNNGHEIALHSITHQVPEEYWAEATPDIIRAEFVDQIQQMAHFANIPANRIYGLRKPFLQLSGNTTFQVMKEYGIEYDISWPTIYFANQGMWPYTLDYASIQDCVIPPCPTASIPGVWVVPMVTWQDLSGTPCSMVDGCLHTPAFNDEEGWYRFILSNFERHYFNNRSPFGFYAHEWFIRISPAIQRALERFLDTVNNLPDAFMVTTKEALDWVKNPVPINEYRQQPCKFVLPTFCQQTSCGPLQNFETGKTMWMTICAPCPRVHPWLHNYLGI